jgi:hypothetical protein
MPDRIHEEALARWLAHGLTSRTHPILAQAFSHCFSPLGIEAEWLECEPFGCLATGLPPCWLRSPRWNPGGVDSAHPSFSALERWRKEPDRVQVGTDGIFRIAGPGEATWEAVRESVRAAALASAFLNAAAALILSDAETAQLYLTSPPETLSRRIWALAAQARGPWSSAGLAQGDPAVGAEDR